LTKLESEIQKVKQEINENQATIHRLERRNEELAHFLGTVDYLKKNDLLDQDKDDDARDPGQAS